MGFCVEFVKNIDLFTVSTSLSTQIVDNSGACTHTPAEHNDCAQTEKKCLHIHINIISSNLFSVKPRARHAESMCDSWQIILSDIGKEREDDN